MKHNHALAILLIGTMPLAGCKKSEATPLSDSSPAASIKEQPKETASPRPSGVDKPVSAKPVSSAVAVQVAQAQAAEAQPKEKSEPTAQKHDAFPNDKGSKLLLELLRPDDATVTRLTQAAKKLPGPPAIERPTPTMPPFKGPPARLPSSPPAKLLPRHVPEPTPLARDRQSPNGPEEIRFSVLALECWPSPDTGEPASLPIMGQYQPDRASLVGPSGESSRQAALAAVVPVRTAPVPFARYNLPDPFENRQPLRTTAVDVEKNDPVVSTPRPLVK